MVRLPGQTIITKAMKDSISINSLMDQPLMETGLLTKYASLKTTALTNSSGSP